MVCWYCSVRTAEAKHSYAFDMYGGLGVHNSETETNVAYNVRHIEIPRCADCRAKHGTAKAAMFMSVVFLAVLLGGALSAVFGWVPQFIAGAWCGLAAGLVIASLLSAVLVQKGICTVRASRGKYPEANDLLKKGYRYGTRPKAAPSQSYLPPAPPSQDTGSQNY